MMILVKAGMIRGSEKKGVQRSTTEMSAVPGNLPPILQGSLITIQIVYCLANKQSLLC